jgi:hypothetical protein
MYGSSPPPPLAQLLDADVVLTDLLLPVEMMAFRLGFNKRNLYVFGMESNPFIVAL